MEGPRVLRLISAWPVKFQKTGKNFTKTFVPLRGFYFRRDSKTMQRDRRRFLAATALRAMFDIRIGAIILFQKVELYDN